MADSDLATVTILIGAPGTEKLKCNTWALLLSIAMTFAGEAGEAAEAVVHNIDNVGTLMFPAFVQPDAAASPAAKSSHPLTSQDFRPIVLVKSKIWKVIEKLVEELSTMSEAPPCLLKCNAKSEKSFFASAAKYGLKSSAVSASDKHGAIAARIPGAHIFTKTSSFDKFPCPKLYKEIFNALRSAGWTPSINPVFIDYPTRTLHPVPPGPSPTSVFATSSALSPAFYGGQMFHYTHPGAQFSHGTSGSSGLFSPQPVHHQGPAGSQGEAQRRQHGQHGQAQPQGAAYLRLAHMPSLPNLNGSSTSTIHSRDPAPSSRAHGRGATPHPHSHASIHSRVPPPPPIMFPIAEQCASRLIPECYKCEFGKSAGSIVSKGGEVSEIKECGSIGDLGHIDDNDLEVDTLELDSFYFNVNNGYFDLWLE